MMAKVFGRCVVNGSLSRGSLCLVINKCDEFYERAATVNQLESQIKAELVFTMAKERSGYRYKEQSHHLWWKSVGKESKHFRACSDDEEEKCLH